MARNAGAAQAGHDHVRPTPQRSKLLAASVAVALHGLVLLVALDLTGRGRPLDAIVPVEFALPPAAADAPAPAAAPNLAPMEPIRQADAPPEAATPPPPDAMSALRPEEASRPEPPPTAIAAQQFPDVAPSDAAPAPAPALASAAPPVADMPAELSHAAVPPPDVVAAAPPRRPAPVAPSPQQPHLARPHPSPHPRRTPRPEPREADPAPVTPASVRDAPAPQTAPPATPRTASLAPSPAASAPSDAVPTWRGEVVARLRRAQRYPEEARSRSEQGVATASFTLDRTGHVLSVSLARSSGVPALDEETVALIHRAEPFPPLPAEAPGATVTLTVPIAFTLR